MSPAEDALLLLRVVQRHLGSLRGTMTNPDFADEDWGFLAQQCVEKMIKALLVLRDVEPPRIHALESLLEMVNETGITVVVPAELLKLEDFAVFARYEAYPTPLPASRRAPDRSAGFFPCDGADAGGELTGEPPISRSAFDAIPFLPWPGSEPGGG